MLCYCFSETDDVFRHQLLTLAGWEGGGLWMWCELSSCNQITQGGCEPGQNLLCWVVLCFCVAATGPTPTVTSPLPPPPAALTCATATTRRDDGRRSSPAPPPPPRATPATSTTTRSLSRRRRRPAASTCRRRRTVRAARRRLTPSAATPTTSTRRRRRPARTPREPHPLHLPLLPSAQLRPLTVNSNCAYMRLKMGRRDWWDWRRRRTKKGNKRETGAAEHLYIEKEKSIFIYFLYSVYW